MVVDSSFMIVYESFTSSMLWAWNTKSPLPWKQLPSVENSSKPGQTWPGQAWPFRAKPRPHVHPANIRLYRLQYTFMLYVYNLCTYIYIHIWALIFCIYGSVSLIDGSKKRPPLPAGWPKLTHRRRSTKAQECTCDSRRVTCVTQQTYLRHVCCVTQQTRLLCDTIDMSAV